MVNSHLSWLAQYGTLFRFSYVFVWVFVLISLVRHSVRTGNTAGTAQFICLGTAIWFSSIGSRLELWVLPVISSMPAVWDGVKALTGEMRLVAMRSVAKRSALALAFAALALWFTLHFGAESTVGLGVRRVEHGVVIGRGEPTLFLLHDNHVLSGGYSGELGKELRAYYKAHPDAPAMFIADSVGSLPAIVDTLVLAGAEADRYLEMYAKGTAVKARQVWLISPKTPWQSLPRLFAESVRVKYVTGEIAANSSVDAPSWVEIVPGAALYVPGWLDRIFNDNPKKKGDK